MTVDEAIQKYGAMEIFEASTAGECEEDYAPLQALGLNIETIEEADWISTAAYDRLTVEEKAANYWEASQDLLYKPESKEVSVGRSGLPGWSSDAE